MPLILIRDDITHVTADAIVNAANSSLLGGGGVDGAIHKAAGRGLLKECKKLGGCETGDAKITKGYKLPCKYVIHTVGPVWKDGNHNEENLLISCYRRSLEIALQKGCESVAFPLISSGAYGYPKDKAFRTAVNVITDFLLENEMTVYLVLFDKKALNICSSVYGNIKEYIDDFYVSKSHLHRQENRRRINTEGLAGSKAEEKNIRYEMEFLEEPSFMPEPSAAPCAAPVFEEKYTLDESFSQMLLRKIDEKGIKDPDCYKKANVDRRLFSKIKSDDKYKPSKQTALALAIALELPLEEVSEMLMKAGYALSPSVLFDVIIKACIENGEYNVFNINEILFEYDQPILK